MISKLRSFVSNIRKISSIDSSVKKIQLDTNHLVVTSKENHDVLVKKLDSRDNRIDILKKSYKDVEPYQPLYGITGITKDDKNTKRTTRDRCDDIYEYFGKNINRMRFLDIGSSLGYVCFYLADRGGSAVGWDYYPKNTEVSQNLHAINGIPNVKFVSKELNLETANGIEIGSYDAIIVLSVFHHLINLYGVEHVQDIVEALLEKAPYLIVELALKGEDSKLAWDKKMPENELDILKNKSEYNVEKIGTHGTHLSGKKRPLYVISRSNVSVNNKKYTVKSRKLKPFEEAPGGADSQREYIITQENSFIKRYSFNTTIDDNKSQIVREVAVMDEMNKSAIKNIPELIDFEISSEGAALVMSQVEGDLLYEKKHSHTQLETITKQLITTLESLEKIGLHHNDIRSWNVMSDGKNATLIDFGLCGYKETENNAIALLWALDAALRGAIEPLEQNKVNLPPATQFEKSKELKKIYEAIKKDKNITFKSLKKSIYG